MLMGDFNELCVDEICASCDLNQIVKIPTRNDATLDLILTNNDNKFYNNPVSLPRIRKNILGGEIYSCCDLIRKTKNLYFYEMF